MTNLHVDKSGGCFPQELRVAVDRLSAERDDLKSSQVIAATDGESGNRGTAEQQLSDLRASLSETQSESSRLNAHAAVAAAQAQARTAEVADLKQDLQDMHEALATSQA